MTKQLFFVLLSLFFIASCSSCADTDSDTPGEGYQTITIAETIQETSEEMPTATHTLVSEESPIPQITPTFPIILTPSPWPTQSMIITPNTDQISRWSEYETALAKELIPAPDPTKILCEWITLGQEDDEIYVWAYCQVDERIPTSSSVPVVIYLGEYGKIKNTDSPRDGSYYPPDVKRLFPPDIQEYIFNQGDWLNIQSLKDHIQYRLEYPGEPPLWIHN